MAGLLDLLATHTKSGVRSSFESDDLDCNVVSWQSGEAIADHVNAEVDVLFVIFAGGGKLCVNGSWTDLEPGNAILVPKNTSRSLVAGENGLAYLVVHKRRNRLMPGSAESRIAGQRSLAKKRRQ